MPNSAADLMIESVVNSCHKTEIAVHLVEVLIDANPGELNTGSGHNWHAQFVVWQWTYV